MSFELSNRQQEIINSPEKRVVVIAAAGSGKALTTNSLVYNQYGRKKIGEVAVGEKIYGEDGKLHAVTGVFPQGQKKVYEVVFSDKTIVECCDEHLWTYQTESLRSKESKNWKTKTLKQILTEEKLLLVDKNNRKNIFIPMTQPVEFEERKVEFEPYTFGALLGDGSFCRSSFTNKDEDILGFVREGLSENGLSLRHYEGYDYGIISGGTQTFSKKLKKYGLWKAHSGDKFIPDDYKFNSVENRVKLLQGLIDTDGYCTGGAYDIVLKSKQMILDCKEVCESLGLTAVYSEKQVVCTNSSTGVKDCGTVYRLRIETSKIFPKLHRSEKREKQWKPSTVYSHRAITEIRDTGRLEEMVCISVDNPTHLFLTNNFIATHNTEVLTERVRKWLREVENPNTIAVITFTNMAAENLRERLGTDYKSGMFVGTIHSLANKFLKDYGVDTSKLRDEEEFDQLFELVKENPECVQLITHIACDEYQDQNSQQNEFILKMIQAENFFIIGDARQCIYQFSGASSSFLKEVSQTPRVKTFSLDMNYRCAEPILAYAKRIIRGTGLIDNSTAYNKQGVCVEKVFNAKELTDALNREWDLSDWAILVRTNNELAYMVNLLEHAGVKTVSFKQGDLTKTELNNLMKQSAVKVLTIHAAKGLGFKNVAVYGARWWNRDEYFINYVGATRAEKRLIWYKQKKRK